ncbi:hypothetical protein RI129_009727 [Pyrocoelia pectoralis]|uniref:Carboxypeptidase n=1 Tax=Pyrocoelia pectoralis TaxID=417401 RepID=A0AAN7ZCH9_9COLE
MSNLLNIVVVVLTFQAHVDYVRCQSEALVVTNLLSSGTYTNAQAQSRVTLSNFPNIESYSGYFKVSEPKNSHLFFWFFKSQGNFTADPVILCLQGGPGLSSLLTLYLENGPLKLTENGDVEARAESWTQFASVLYIDSPVRTGFSFGNEYSATNDVITQDLHEATKQFLRLFPELTSNELYLWGESYGGTYVPALGKAIQEANLVNPSQRINLCGMMIGNGLINLRYQTKISDFLYSTGLADTSLKTIIAAHENAIYESMISENYQVATDNFMAIMGVVYPKLEYHSLYNFMQQFSPFYTLAAVQQEYLSSANMKNTLHVGNQTYIWGNGDVTSNLTDYAKPQSSSVEYLLNHIKVLIYSGQADIIIPYISTVNYLRTINFDGAETYRSAGRQLWRLNNDLAGYVRQVNRLTEVCVRNAGHNVPLDQPLAAFTMVKKFINNEGF